jgi:hypothetical protein
MHPEALGGLSHPTIPVEKSSFYARESLQKCAKSTHSSLETHSARLLIRIFSRFFHIGFNEGPQKSMKNSPPGVKTKKLTEQKKMGS